MIGLVEVVLGAACLVGVRFARPHKREPRADDADQTTCSFIDWKIEHDRKERERMRGQR